MRNATKFRTFCFEDNHYAFQETLCPVTLAHIRSLYFIQVYIFIPLINSAPFLRFSHILLYTNFFLCTPGAPGMYITTQNIFLKAGLHATICRPDLSARQCRSANRTCILTPDPKVRLEECFVALVLS